ncbi:MAG: S8 family serine peptidase [Brucellaceae bacterium]|nr:S8 family serine peptidase [Brucellaceae bacterium]
MAAALSAAHAGDIDSRIAAAFETPEYLAGGGLNLIGASTAYDAGFTGAGTVIVIIDNGFDINHPEFAGNIVDSSNTAAGGGPVPVAFHGTHVAGIAAALKDDIAIHGVAYDALLALYTYGGAPGAAFTAAAALRPAAINNSYGQDVNVNVVLANPAGFVNDPDTTTLVNAIKSAQQNSVVVWAASNLTAFTDIDISAGLPLVFPELQKAWIAVVNVDANGTLQSAPCGSGALFCLAGPGTAILSTQDGGGYAVDSGTSMAAPHVTGAVAIARQIFPDATPAELTQLMLQTATDIGAPGIDYQFGWGLLNLANVVASFDPETGDLFPAAGWSGFEALGHFGGALQRRFGTSGADPIPLLAYASGGNALVFSDEIGASRGAWIEAIGGFSNLAAGASSSAYSTSLLGFAAGVESEFANGLRAGLAGGYTRQNLNAATGGNSGTSNGFHLGAYGEIERNGWRLEGNAQFGYFDQTLIRRAISGAAGTSVTRVGTSNPQTIAGEVELRGGRLFKANGGTVMPYLRAAVRGQQTAAFTETGAGIFSLSVARSSMFQAEFGLGIRAETTLAATENHTVVASADLSYSYLTGDRTSSAQAMLLGRSIATSAATVGAHIADLGGQLSLRCNEGRFSASLSYRGRLQRNSSRHTGGARLVVGF